MKIFMKFVVLAFAYLCAAMAFAQGSGHLELTTVVQKEQISVDDDGKQQKELVQAATVLPGDSVIYTITFRNVSQESAENVTITNPVPVNLTYESGSAFGPGTVIEFSVDGGKYYSVASELTVTENGEVRAATADDYTHIRWIMQNDLAAGAQGVARFRARLN